MAEKIVYVNFSEIDTQQSSLPVNPILPDNNINASIQDVSISGNIQDVSLVGTDNSTAITAVITQPEIVGNISNPGVLAQEQSNGIIANVSQVNITGALKDAVGITASASQLNGIATVVNNPLNVQISTPAITANPADAALRFTTIGEVIKERNYSGGLFKGTDEYVYVTDSVSFATGFFRSFDESASVTDQTSNELNKATNENINIIEAILKQSDKSLLETLTIQETFSKDINKPLATDSYTISDVVSNNLNKAQTESVVSSDIITKAIDKGILETINLTESLAIVTTFNRIFTDSITVTDSISNTLNKALQDTFSLSDITQTIIFIAYVLDVLETIAASDALSVAFTQSNQETVYPTDDIFGEAVIDDDQYFGVNKGVIDTYSINDITLLNLNKQPTDTVTLVESGIIYNQGYFADVTYVQLYYVGDVRTIG